MSSPILPMEVWQMIFRFSDGKSVMNCRLVCKFWKSVIDDLNEEAWRQILNREDGASEYENKIEMTLLSWKNMYKSVTQWKNINEAKMSYKATPTSCVQQFQVLDDGVLAVVQNTNGCILSRAIGYGDTIIYFNLDTFQEIDQIKLGFLFIKYEENDRFICVINEDNRLCVMPKENSKAYSVGKLLPVISEVNGEYTMFDKEVFYQLIGHQVAVCSIISDKGEETVSRVVFKYFPEHVISFTYASTKRSCFDIFLFTKEGNFYRYKNDVFQPINLMNTGYMNKLLSQYGFNWTSQSIYTWLTDFFKCEQTLQISTCHVNTLCLHFKYILMGTENHTIQICDNPFEPNGDLRPHRGPYREIDMNQIFPSKMSVKHISQLYAVERLNAHKILVLTNNKLFVLDFVHKETKDQKKGRKRKGPVVVVRNFERILRSRRHKYMTRSSVKK